MKGYFIRATNMPNFKVFAETIDEKCTEQINRLMTASTYRFCKVRIMPDCHAGNDCMIGTTIQLKDVVTPSLIGSDIGCGMLVVKLYDRRINLEKLNEIVNAYIPAGNSVFADRKCEDNFLIGLKCRNHVDLNRAYNSIGTLGGGNHFIEVDKSDKTGDLYLVIHSGSRHLGAQINKYYQDIAIKNSKEIPQRETFKKIIERMKKEGNEKCIQSTIDKIKMLPNNINKFDFPVLKDNLRDDYRVDSVVACKYAKLNREYMAWTIINLLNIIPQGYFHTLHNYIDEQRWILRKGAVSASLGEEVIIPMNMRDGSLLCKGKGNRDWNYSAPHGAGRIMSRKQAKEQVSFKEYKDSMKDVYSTSVVPNTVDESPMAYKSMDEIKKLIEPTVEIVDHLTPIYNFKAKE